MVLRDISFTRTSTRKSLWPIFTLHCPILSLYFSIIDLGFKRISLKVSLFSRFSHESMFLVTNFLNYLGHIINSFKAYRNLNPVMICFVLRKWLHLVCSVAL